MKLLSTKIKTKTLGAVVLSTLIGGMVGCNQAPPEHQTDYQSQESVQTADASERLGTAWGDEVTSNVVKVDLRRTSNEPIEQTQVYYANKSYAGRPVNTISLMAGKVEFSAETDRRKLPLYRDAGHYYLKGNVGEPYSLVYHNNTANTYEIVTSVDGLNVLNGNSASRYDSGYVLDPYDDLVIEGFRKSQSAVASFVFSAPQDAYASNTPAGSINNTGIIGTVVYELYDPSKPKPANPQAFPEDNGYAQPPK